MATREVTRLILKKFPPAMISIFIAIVGSGDNKLPNPNPNPNPLTLTLTHKIVGSDDIEFRESKQRKKFKTKETNRFVTAVRWVTLKLWIFLIGRSSKKRLIRGAATRYGTNEPIGSQQDWRLFQRLCI